MKRKRIICLFLFVVLILVFSSCHPRHVSDIKQDMTKEEVASLWGRTPLISYRTVDGKAVETWEYHFSSTDSICWVTFSQDKVAATQCRPVRGGTYWSYSQPGQSKAGPPPSEQNLVREGSFAMELAEVLKIGEVKSEAEAENKLTSAGIAPKNGWIADYPVTPDIIGELRNAVGEAADSGKIAMKREEAIKAFQDLMTSIESQSAGIEPPIGGQPYPEPYYDPYYYSYYYPYPYYYGGYYYPYPYPYFSGGFVIRGFRGGGFGGRGFRGGGHGGSHHGRGR
ncbi:MAG: hypothetical protein ACXWMO_06815 [Syntrophales bacterium]